MFSLDNKKIFALCLLLFSPFLAHAQVEINPAELFFFCILLFLFFIINLLFPFIAFDYALNAESYSKEKNKKRAIIVGLFSIVHVWAIMYIILPGKYIVAGLIFMFIPLIFFLLGTIKVKQKGGAKFLFLIYLINAGLFIYGGYDNPLGYGPKHGTYIIYNTSHNPKDIQRIESFYLGTRTGEYKDYNWDGKLKEEGFYLKGKKHGHWKRYTFGEVSEEGDYTNGEQNGIWKRYSFGNLYEEQNYSNGIKIGKLKKY